MGLRVLFCAHLTRLHKIYSMHTQTLAEYLCRILEACHVGFCPKSILGDPILDYGARAWADVAPWCGGRSSPLWVDICKRFWQEPANRFSCLGLCRTAVPMIADFRFFDSLASELNFLRNVLLCGVEQSGYIYKSLQAFIFCSSLFKLSLMFLTDQDFVPGLCLYERLHQPRTELVHSLLNELNRLRD